MFLPHLDEWNARRCEVARSYDEVLSAHGIPVDGGHQTDNVYHHYVLMHQERDQVSERLSALEVPTRIHYGVPAYRHPALGEYEGPRLPGAEHRAAQALSLPIHPWMTEDSVGMICEALDESL